MARTVRIRLERYPDPPDLEHYLRICFKLGKVYDLPPRIARTLIARGDAVLVSTEPTEPMEPTETPDDPTR